MNTVGTPPRAWDAFDAYLFDIDGTLLHCTDAVHYFAFCDALKYISGKPLTLEGVVAHGNTDVGILRDALALANVPEAHWRPMLPQVRDAMCRFVETRKTDLCTTLLPRVRDVLEHLRARGAVLGVATGNLQGIGKLKLQRAGLVDLFDFGSWSDVFEYRADVFQAAVEQARVLAGKAASVCAIGDTPSDISAARNNGLHVIAVATGIYSFDQLQIELPDICLHSFEGLFP
jgi:phosphoglycolate phosphatase